MTDGETTKPTPDPTVLTTEQLLREIERTQSLVSSMVDGLSELTSERFRSVDRQFADAELRRQEQKLDTKQAVDAALISQKEAVREQTTASERAIAKSESATTRQLEQLNASFSSSIKSVTDAFNDLKTRVERIENVKAGGDQKLSGIYAALGASVALIALMVFLSRSIQ